MPTQQNEVGTVPLEVQVERYRNGNTALLEALMGMVLQFFCEGPDGTVNHSFMSAEEHAIEVLMEAGMAEEVPGKGYRLLWGALADRKPRVQTWEEAVNECVTDPAERERLLAFGDGARTQAIEGDARWGVLGADSLGAPQHRARIWILANAHHTRRQGTVRQGEPYQAREEWPAARRQLVRPDRGLWPPGPRAVSSIPLQPDGVAHRVDRLKALGNGQVPAVAATAWRILTEES